MPRTYSFFFLRYLTEYNERTTLCYFYLSTCDEKVEVKSQTKAKMYQMSEVQDHLQHEPEN